jgi:hypothetical protein
MNHRVLVVGLDGWDHGHEERLRAEGELPNLTELSGRSARFRIDPQGMQLDGLDWEHFLAGAGPEATHRACVVDFDPSDYTAWQRSASVTPFVTDLPIRSVVFDVPYFDLSGAPSTCGVVGWAASDPGIDETQARPDTLIRWIDSEIGTYPAMAWLDTVAWPSVERTASLGRHLVDGIGARRDAVGRLLAERLPEWDLAVVAVTETHSATEALWHGVDADHPLHGHPSSRPAAAALRDVYRATDQLIGDLIERTGAEHVVVLALNGMASNRFDVPTMVLLPELLLRWACGTRLLTVPATWASSPQEIPLLAADGPSWTEACVEWFGAPVPTPSSRRRRLQRVRSRITTRSGRADGHGSATASAEHRISVAWHPAMRYQPRWPQMAAFALPSFAAGHIRVNLKGRERQGIVETSDYARVCDELEELLHACTNPATGRAAVKSVTRSHATDPRGLDRADPDLRVTWESGVCALEHPDHGLVGPVPFRRTGDHMGIGGFVNIAGPDISSGDRGACTVLDLAPTISSLTGVTSSRALPGRDLLADQE